LGLAELDALAGRHMPVAPVPAAVPPTAEAALPALFDGLVVESLAVRQDFGAATVGCRACGGGLGAGDRVRVALSCYEDQSWEIAGVYCADHEVTVADAMGVRAETQAVVAAALASGTYDPPRGDREADALVLADVSVASYSPTEAGY
jgi:hypothetical protein